jgi:pimeloyl-ACP methyl ester carboxylesterase
LSSTVPIAWRGRSVEIEYACISAAAPGAPLMVFLHEGLGSLSMWRDFPARLCHALGLRGLVYSRPGYGRSTPREPDERWAPDFMHRQAHEVLPALLQALGVDAEDRIFKRPFSLWTAPRARQNRGRTPRNTAPEAP